LPSTAALLPRDLARSQFCSNRRAQLPLLVSSQVRRFVLAEKCEQPNLLVAEAAVSQRTPLDLTIRF